MPTFDQLRSQAESLLADNTTGEISPSDVRTVAVAAIDKMEEVDESVSGGAWGEITGDLSDQTDLQAALDDLQEQIDSATGGSGLGTSIAYTTAIPLNKGNSVMTKVMTADIVFTENSTGAGPGAGFTILLQQDTTPRTVTFPAGWIEEDNSDPISTTAGMIHRVIGYYDGQFVTYSIKEMQVGTLVQTLTTPTFSADAISDTVIDLTSISYDGASTGMTIERATNSGFTTGLTSLYSGVPKASHSDTGLTTSTHYYYRIKTTAAGYTDSDYGYDDETTDATGLTQLSTPTLTVTTASASQIGASWTNVANESSYKLEWSANGSTGWTQIGGTIAANTTSYNHTGLSPLTQYFYRISAIGDGVTYSNSGYGTDNDTTTAATLNAPTSFAVGTPTADGAPFTWADTNAAPANEASYLIQITTTADTGYAAVVATRTPAADATSAAAGTGLTASTGYRARIKAVGNGTSTLDSAYSSEVTFTTAAGSATFITIDTSSGTITESPAHTFNIATDAHFVADQTIAIGERVYATVGGSSNEVAVLGIDADATLEQYSSGGPTPNWSAYIFMYLGNYQVNGSLNPGGTLIDTGVAYTAGDKFGIRLADVAGDTKAIACYHDGSTWIDLHTFATDFPSASANIKGESSLAATVMIDPKTEAV